MMNNNNNGGSSSECSSGCESGWTLYLEHSNSNFSVSDVQKCRYLRNNNKHRKMSTFDDDDDDDDDEGGRKNGSFDNDDDDEEDLSMVSDASSGPPHFDHDVDDDDDDDDVQVFCYGGKRRQQSMRLSTNTQNHHHHHQCFKTQDLFALDDTASSPDFISKKNGGENQGCTLKRVIDYSSQGFSATHYNQGRSNNLQEHYGFIQPSFSTKQLQQNQWS